METAPQALTPRYSAQKLFLEETNFVLRVEAILNGPLVFIEECIYGARNFFAVNVPARDSIGEDHSGPILSMRSSLIGPNFGAGIKIAARQSRQIILIMFLDDNHIH
jgi:hypothetical protein